DTTYMATHFGWRAVLAVFINAALVTLVCRKVLADASDAAACGTAKASGREAERPPAPPAVIAVHVLFLVGIVLSAHHPAVFLGLLMLFIGYAEAYKRHQSRLLIKEGLMVGFFLAGLVVLGGLQKWWLQ